jgi:hypothetical protein
MKFALKALSSKLVIALLLAVQLLGVGVVVAKGAVYYAGSYPCNCGGSASWCSQWYSSGSSAGDYTFECCQASGSCWDTTQ